MESKKRSSQLKTDWHNSGSASFACDRCGKVLEIYIHTFQLKGLINAATRIQEEAYKRPRSKLVKSSRLKRKN